MSKTTTTSAPASRVQVLRRLRDLREWALFIRDSVGADEEAGKRELIAAYMGDDFLREFGVDSQRLVDRLDRVIHSILSSAGPAERLGVA